MKETLHPTSNDTARPRGPRVARFGRRTALSTVAMAVLAAVLTAGPAAPPAAAGSSARIEVVRAAQQDRLIIPSIGFDKAIAVGNSSQIDQGKVTLMKGCWPGTARTPYPPCSTTWIAAHRSTHGSPFKDLPRVKVGATVIITHAGMAYTYQITHKASANRSATPKSVFHRDLLLQTSKSSKTAWVLNGRLVRIERI